MNDEVGRHREITADFEHLRCFPAGLRIAGGEREAQTFILAADLLLFAVRLGVGRFLIEFGGVEWPRILVDVAGDEG